MKSKKGFTLVELLIVIVVIGILSAMMMLSSTEAVSSARVAQITNNLRQWRTALLAWYMDHHDIVNSKGEILNASVPVNNTTRGHLAENVNTIEVAKYISGEFTEVEPNGYYYAETKPVKDGSGMVYWLRHKEVGGKFEWYVFCQYANNDNDKRLVEKLAKNASRMNLTDRDFKPYTTEGGNRHVISIKVIDFSKK